MRVETWGDRLAVCLSLQLIDSLGLKEGDQVDIQVQKVREGSHAGGTSLQPKMTREEVLEALRAIRLSVPPGEPDYKFNREELYDRSKRD